MKKHILSSDEEGENEYDEAVKTWKISEALGFQAEESLKVYEALINIQKERKQSSKEKAKEDSKG